MAELATKDWIQLNREAKEIAAKLQDLNRRERAINILKQSNQVTFLLAETFRADEGVTYEELLHVWQMDIDAPEADFRIELEEAFNAGRIHSIGASLFDPKARLYLREDFAASLNLL